MIDTIFKTPWGVMRWIRLVLGVVLFVQIIIKFDVILALFSGILLYQSIFNAGCLSGACAAPENINTNSTSSDEDEYIEYEDLSKK
jgi:hypothetical protein